jgi:hypothetical protein
MLDKSYCQSMDLPLENVQLAEVYISGQWRSEVNVISVLSVSCLRLTHLDVEVISASVGSVVDGLRIKIGAARERRRGNRPGGIKC